MAFLVVCDIVSQHFLSAGRLLNMKCSSKHFNAARSLDAGADSGFYFDASKWWDLFGGLRRVRECDADYTARGKTTLHKSFTILNEIYSQ